MLWTVSDTSIINFFFNYSKHGLHLLYYNANQLKSPIFEVFILQFMQRSIKFIAKLTKKIKILLMMLLMIPTCCIYIHFIFPLYSSRHLVSANFLSYFYFLKIIFIVINLSYFNRSKPVFLDYNLKIKLQSL